MPASNYLHLTSASTVLVSAAPTKLAGFVVNKPGTTAVLQLFDDPTGAGTGAVIASAHIAGVGFFSFDVQTLLGLTASLSFATAPDITLCWG